MQFSLADIFNSNSSVPAPAPTPANPPAPNSAAPAPSDGKPPFDKSTTPDPAPLDKFGDLFKVEPVDPNNPNQDPDAPYFTIPTDEQLAQQVSTMRFIDTEAHAELIQKAVTGDVKAFAQLLNTVGQQSYAQGARLSARVAENATRTGVDRVKSTIPETIRSNLARSQVTELNPAFSHPAMAPLVHSARTLIESKYPNASPAEVASLTNEYLQGVKEMMSTPTPTQQAQIKSKQPQDFGSFFGGQ